MMKSKYPTPSEQFKVPEKSLKQSQMETASTHVHDRSFSWLGTGS